MKIAISVPTYGACNATFTYSLAMMIGRVCSDPPVPNMAVSNNIMIGSILPSVRHDLIMAAKKQSATHMLWLDSDMEFPPDTLHRLMKHDKEIVAANYVTRKLPIIPVSQDLNSQRVNSNGKTGLQEVRHCGLGVCLVDMKVIEAMEPPYFMFGYTKSGKFVGEDVFFLHRARNNGTKVYIDHDLSNEVAHIGEYRYDMESCPAVEHAPLGDNWARTGNGPGADPRPGNRDVGADVGLAVERI